MASCPGASSRPAPAASPDFSFQWLQGDSRNLMNPMLRKGCGVPSLASHNSFFPGSQVSQQVSGQYLLLLILLSCWTPKVLQFSGIITPVITGTNYYHIHLMLYQGGSRPGKMCVFFTFLSFLIFVKVFFFSPRQQGFWFFILSLVPPLGSGQCP